MEIKGTVKKLLDIFSGTSKAGKEWSKQELVIETDNQFQSIVCVTFFGDKVSLINNVTEGDQVTIQINLESREFNEKWYHNINGWALEIETPDYVSEVKPEEGNELHKVVENK